MSYDEVSDLLGVGALAPVAWAPCAAGLMGIESVRRLRDQHPRRSRGGTSGLGSNGIIGIASNRQIVMPARLPHSSFVATMIKSTYTSDNLKILRKYPHG
jgi:hypothetical protein